MRTSKIRICYGLNTFDLGGAETVAYDLARSHDPEAFEVEVAAFTEPRRANEAEMHRRLREAGVRTASIVQDSYRSPRALWRIYLYLRRGHFDIIHGHSRGSDYWGVRLGGMAGIPYRFWTRHSVYNDMSPRQLRRYRWAAQRADGVVAVSDAVRNACISREGIPAERVQTIVNGIDGSRFRVLATDERNAVRASLGVGEGNRLLLFVGRFDDLKAPEAFPALVASIRRRDPTVKGFMCGYGPLHEKLVSLAAASGGVEILGLRSDVPDLLGACDLFVSTSRNEGLPLNVMEAMACGAAFVAPRIPQIEQLAGSDAVLRGQLVDPPPLNGDLPNGLVDAWAATALVTLQDPERCRRVGMAGHEIIARRFTLAATVSRYEALFYSAAARRGNTKD